MASLAPQLPPALSAVGILYGLPSLADPGPTPRAHSQSMACGPSEEHCESASSTWYPLPERAVETR